MINKILIKLFILQKVDNRKRLENKLQKLGRGYMYAYRVNPYNPLSYIFIPIILLVGVLAFGFYGILNEMDFSNPFKWR